jgi:NitT/TauT family transport system substrate-binding protein
MGGGLAKAVSNRLHGGYHLAHAYRLWDDPANEPPDPFEARVTEKDRGRPMYKSRREFLSAVAATASAASLLPTLPGMGAEERLETTTVRFGKIQAICFAPQYVAEQLLRDEGFTHVSYVDTTPVALTDDLGRGVIDFATAVTPQHIAAIDASAPITIVSGVHAGCYELLGHNGIRAIADLKGKTVGTSTAADLIQIMAAYVGLDPKKDVKIVIDVSGKALEQFVEGKLDAYMGLPPEPQLLHSRGFRQPVVRTAVDPPWSQYFCCSLAGNRAFVAKNPVATKRVIRAILKAADLCASEPMRAARFLVDHSFTPNVDYALQTFNENPYGRWREYDPEDTIRFYSLRQHELGIIKKTPQKIIAEGTDWRFFNELKRELKA